MVLFCLYLISQWFIASVYKYKNIFGFYILILYPVTLIKLFISSSTVFVDYLEFSKLRIKFYFFLSNPYNFYLCFLSYWIC